MTTTMNQSRQRRQAIERLERLGGVLVPGPDEKYVSAETQRSVFGNTFMVKQLEKDNIITRRKHATRTLEIRLRGYEGHKIKPVVARPTDATELVQAVVVPPELDTTLTVSMVARDEKGHLQIGLRNGKKTWLMEVVGTT